MVSVLSTTYYLSRPVNVWVHMGLIPNDDPETIRIMLSYIGVKDIKELYSDVPNEILLSNPPEIGSPLKEADLSSLFESITSSVPEIRLSFTGGGIADHYVPAIVDEIVSKQEFYTSYTPYQPEISQGLLQAIFEYQSLMAELLDMDVVNASLYDSGSALGEAARFSMRVTKRKRIIYAKNANPERLSVLSTYVSPLDVELVSVPYDEETGRISLASLEAQLNEDTAMVYLENPNFFGIIEEEAEEVADLVHEKGGLFVVGVEPISLGVIRPPGDYGADVVVGEGQSLGGYLNFGGPSLGIFAIKSTRKMIRQVPGRLIGMTKDLEGTRSYMMVLQSREQHIRQEEATSNITTNSQLMALRAAIYLSLLGPDGLRDLGRKILLNTEYLRRSIEELPCFKVPFKSKFFRDLPVVSEGPSWKEVNLHLLYKGIAGGFVPSTIYKEFPESLAILATTERHCKRDIDELIDNLRGFCS